MRATALLRLVLGGLALTAAGCRSSSPGTRPSDPAPEAAVGAERADSTPAKPRPRRDRNVLTPDELTAGRYPNAYVAIEALHPDWLRPQGGPKSLHGFSPHVPVFEAGRTVNMGFEYLRQLGAVDFVRIVRLSSVESAFRYGAERSWGALVVYRP
jgi:hypothetical protein